MKWVELCKFEVVNCYLGYFVGGMLLFGMCKMMFVYVEVMIFDLLMIYLNGGWCGYLVSFVLVVFMLLFGVWFV